MTRWIVHARAAFTATHALQRYNGRAEAPHSHRWEVAVRVGARTLGEEGYALDFHAVRRTLEAAVAALDGSDLTAHPSIGTPTPSAENVALHIARELGPRYGSMGGTLLSVSVWEGPENRVDLLLDDDRDGVW